jgi:predicted small secreted protein
MKRVLLVLVLLSTVAVSGCSNTWRGMGQDIERAGRSMQR